jgi:beta-xylosidase
MPVASDTNAQRAPAWPFADEFTSPVLTPGWQWPWDRQPKYEILPNRLGSLLLSAKDNAGSNLGAVLARPALTTDYAAATRIETGGLPATARAGLVAYGDFDNAIGISVSREQIIVWRREKGIEKPLAVEEAPANARAFYLRITARKNSRFQFGFSTDNQTWKTIGPDINGDSLPPWDRSMRVALTAAGPDGLQVRFDWLRIDLAQPEAAGAAGDQSRDKKR